ncbi:class II glutamine amidotransferase [Nocardia vinacea]|uniref:hypothetical protein n=1 Tax=Nocardia vinacea TaxID=96468 RepID=UPI002E1118D5|nr:class II glutamine amidotransferase [Nocardia vinacea]
MCLLTCFPPGVAPDPSALRIGAHTNHHGHGYALIIGGQIRTDHSMNPEPLIEEFIDLRARHRDGYALFHSRYATRGVHGIENCHPFPLGNDPRTVLAHNGTLPKRVHPRAYDPRSDTRIAAEEYLAGQPFGSIDTHRGARGLASWLGTSKLLILTVDPTYHHRAYLFGEQAGIWEDGIWYSNTSYQPMSRRWPDRYRLRCGGCREFDLDRRGRHCTGCGWCFDCEQPFPHCDCYPRRTTGHHSGKTPSLTRPRSGGHHRALARFSDTA